MIFFVKNEKGTLQFIEGFFISKINGV